MQTVPSYQAVARIATEIMQHRTSLNETERYMLGVKMLMHHDGPLSDAIRLHFGDAVLQQVKSSLFFPWVVPPGNSTCSARSCGRMRTLSTRSASAISWRCTRRPPPPAFARSRRETCILSLKICHARRRVWPVVHVYAAVACVVYHHSKTYSV